MLTEKRIAAALAEAGAEDPHAAATATSAAISECGGAAVDVRSRVEWALERLCEREPSKLADVAVGAAIEGVVRPGVACPVGAFPMSPLGARRSASIEFGGGS